MTAPTPALVTCPGCTGKGALTCPVCKGACEVTEAGRLQSGYGIARDSLVFGAQAERDQWRALANALLAAAFGGDLGSPSDKAAHLGMWHATPPAEFTDALREGQGDIAEIVRAAMMGRAWKVRGRDGEGGCDYPLCRHRQRTAMERAERGPRAGHGSGMLDFPLAGGARLTVCQAGPVPNAQTRSAPWTTDAECETWARWVAARVASGAVTLPTR